MNKSYYLILSLLLFVSCTRKEPKQLAPTAISTAESVRDRWMKSRKSIELFVEGMSPVSLKHIGKLGVYSATQDATPEEQSSLLGVPFRYDCGERFIPIGRDILIGDSMARFYVCYPYLPEFIPGKILALQAPYEDYLFGEEVSRTFAEKFSVRLKLNYATSLLRLRLESPDITDHLHQVSVRGNHLYTKADYHPYVGAWQNFGGANTTIEYAFDRLMNNYHFVDVFLPPIDEPTDISLSVKMNTREYTTHTTLPRLAKGEMTQLNLSVESSGLRILSSWVQERTEMVIPQKEQRDTVEIGDYLQLDGTISLNRDSASVAIVYETNGKHGKAVALEDVSGLWRFSFTNSSSGKYFPTVDGTAMEGLINPMQADSINYRFVYKPSLPYPTTCAFGYAHGSRLSKALLSESKEVKANDMLSILSTMKGAYIPSVAEFAHLYYLMQPYSETKFPIQNFMLPEGSYLSSSESSSSTFYMFDFTDGAVSGAFSKRFSRLKLRLFYVF
jgi:hypothetical protein